MMLKSFIFFLAFLFLTNAAVYPEYRLEPGTEWVLAWSDEFDGPDLNLSNWNYDLGFGDVPEKNFWGWGVGGIQDYTSNKDNVYISNGNLVLQANFTGGEMDKRNYTSGKIHTQNKRSFQYGIIAARIKMPVGKGTFPAFWLLGISNTLTNNLWPACGEIDIVELFDGGITANAAAHWYDEVRKTPVGTSASTSMQYQLPGKKAFAEEYHIYELIWKPSTIISKIDGKKIFQCPITPATTSELRAPMFLILNLGIGSWFERVSYPDAATVFPQTMSVDWVRVYRSKE